MRKKRLRTKLFSVWLHPKEFEYLSEYAENNLATSSEIIRAWIHEAMKKEGYEIRSPNSARSKNQN